MTRDDCLKLGKILARMDSPFQGERDAAERLARAFMAKHQAAAPAAASAARAIVVVAAPAPAKQTLAAQQRTERRRSGRGHWRGYCRRRQCTAGAALNVAA